jgi:hypothetical protein
LDGRVGFEGSTNWSASGEGTFVVKGRPGRPGYKAQNNTLAVFTDPETIARFTAELVAEHLAARGPGLRHHRAAERSSCRQRVAEPTVLLKRDALRLALERDVEELDALLRHRYVTQIASTLRLRARLRFVVVGGAVRALGRRRRLSQLLREPRSSRRIRRSQ